MNNLDPQLAEYLKRPLPKDATHFGSASHLGRNLVST